jgi:hypothetical protein
LLSNANTLFAESMTATLRLVAKQNSLHDWIKHTSAGFGTLVLEITLLAAFISLISLSFWNRWEFSLNRFNHDDFENGCKSFGVLLVMHLRATT